VKTTLEGPQAKVIVDGKISNPFVISRWFVCNIVLHLALKNLEQNNMILNRLTQICGYAEDILVIGRSLQLLKHCVLRGGGG